LTGEDRIVATSILQTSQLLPEDALHSFVVEAGDPFLLEVWKGQVVRIIDLEGNQAVDTNAPDFVQR
jgi:uncharacterized protein YcgI (DUF1989 family)